MTARSNSVHARDVEYYMHPYTDLSTHAANGPLVITRGEGIYVYDDAGNRYIEGISGLFCASLGFSEDRLIDAAIKQMRMLPFYHAFAGKSNEPGVELAERLIAMAPTPMSKVFFANSGSEANDTAIKLAWYYHNAIGKPEKKKIVSRVNAYHGVTIATASLTGIPNNHREFDLPISGILHTDCPCYYRFGKPGESEETYATRCAASLTALIEREGPDTVAAFIAEPFMVSGGCYAPPKTYFQKIQAVLRKYKILLIVDEVICGFGRTGNMFGSETYGLKPDIMTMAKQLSAAYLPISAVMINEKIYRAAVQQSEKIGIFAHGFTYGGHPVPAAVALEALKIYEERDIVGHVRRLAPHFREHLDRLAAHPLVGEARGVGLVAGLELVKNKRTKENFELSDRIAPYVAQRALANGVITRGAGHVVNLCPPLVTTAAQLDQLASRIKKALDETYAYVSERRLIEH